MSTKQIFQLLSCLIFIFFINLSIKYTQYQDFSYEELYETDATVLNIYKKDDFDILKLKSDDFVFFSKFKKNSFIKRYDTLKIGILSLDISFIDFLRGFYTKTIYFDVLSSVKSTKENLENTIKTIHKNTLVSQFYNALFFASPISYDLRSIFSNYGISHLIALSGFHLSVFSFILFALFFYPYKFFQDRFFPYRNRKFDILLLSLACMFVYVVFTGLVPSLLRAFVMMSFAVFLLRFDIKIFSFLTLLIVAMLILAFFPEFLFSLSFFFSLIAVFYIFLFVRYFKDIKSKLLALLFFNIWIFFAMKPVVHFFFANTTFEQLLSPFLSMAFIVFYPLSLLFHILDFGGFFDDYLLVFFSHTFDVHIVSSSLWFFMFYLIISFLAIFYKYAFYFLNFLLLGFSFYLYV